MKSFLSLFPEIVHQNFILQAFPWNDTRSWSEQYLLQISSNVGLCSYSHMTPYSNPCNPSGMGCMCERTFKFRVFSCPDLGTSWRSPSTWTNKNYKMDFTFLPPVYELIRAFWQRGWLNNSSANNVFFLNKVLSGKGRYTETWRECRIKGN